MPSASLRSIIERTAGVRAIWGRMISQQVAMAIAQTSRRAAGAGRPGSLLLEELSGGIGEDLREDQPRHGQRQDQVEGLSADVQDQRFAADEEAAELAEVRFQADAHERQAEEP